MDLFTFIVVVVFSSILAIKIIVFILMVVFVYFVDLRRKKKYNSSKNSPSNSVKSVNKQSIIRSMYESFYKYLQFKIGYMPFEFIRLFFYKHLFHLKIGKKVRICHGLEIRDGFKITIGDNSIIGDNCLLDGRNSITIESNVNISSNVQVYTLQHDTQSSSFSCNGGAVVIKKHSWVSSNSTILPNVSVGEGAVLACGSIATKDIEPFSIYGGIPARFLKKRNKNLDYQLDKPPFNLL